MGAPRWTTRASSLTPPRAWRPGAPLPFTTDLLGNAAIPVELWGVVIGGALLAWGLAEGYTRFAWRSPAESR